MSDLTHVFREKSAVCKYCEIPVGLIDEPDGPCPEHPDRQREDDDDLTHDLKRKVVWKRGMNKTRCDYCDEWIHHKQWDEECPDRQPTEDDDDWKEYERKGSIEARPYKPGKDLSGVSVSDEDDPKQGDMIARNPDNHDDKWLIDQDYFMDKYLTGGEQPAEDDDDGEMICYTDDVDESACVDDGEGDVSREIAERFMDGEYPWEWGEMGYPHMSLRDEIDAIREHCELAEDGEMPKPDLMPECYICQQRDKMATILPSQNDIRIHQHHLREIEMTTDEQEGVCEWTDMGVTDDAWESSCSYQYALNKEKIEAMNRCPGCEQPIEITTDEGGGFECEYEVGDVVKEIYKGDYYLIIGINTDIKVPRYYITGDEVKDGAYWTIGNQHKLEKVGEFAPDDDALERVSPECNGSLFLEDVGDDRLVLFDPLCRKAVPDEPIILTGYLDDGTARRVSPPNLEATGIVIDFHGIAKD